MPNRRLRQGKELITDLIIEFETLAMKAKTDNVYTIFLLKKNVRNDIIKAILGYLLMVVLKLFDICHILIHISLYLL